MRAALVESGPGERHLYSCRSAIGRGRMPRRSSLPGREQLRSLNYPNIWTERFRTWPKSTYLLREEDCMVTLRCRNVKNFFTKS
jgi:hypothetical protein